MKYKFKTTPYKHQKQAIRKLLDNGFGGALLMEPRTGKTKTTIDYLSILAQAGKIDRVVIVAPARVLDVWVQEFHAHCPLLHHVYVWDKKARKQPLPPVNGVFMLSVLLVNYEAFAVPGKKLPSGRRSKATGRFATRAAIRKWLEGKPAACVLDESHKIKSPSGKASVMVVSLHTLFRYRLILTGTPVTKAKRIFDIYMQWNFLNPDRFGDLPTASDFKNHYGQWTNKNGYDQFLKERNTDELRERIHADAFAITRAECYDLPPSSTVIERIPLDTKAGTVYDTLAAEMVARVEEEHERLEDDAAHDHITEASIALTLALRLSQITGGFAKTTEGKTIQVGSEKLRRLEELLDDAIENEEKLVVCGRFRPELDAIVQMCARKYVPSFEVRGGLSRAEVTNNIRDFKDIDGVAVCVLNPRAGGVGIDLSSAAHMVWYSLPTSWVDYSQCCDRIALSQNATTYTYLLAENTSDELLYDTLQGDGDVAKAVVANPRKVLR